MAEALFAMCGCVVGVHVDGTWEARCGLITGHQGPHGSPVVINLENPEDEEKRRHTAADRELLAAELLRTGQMSVHMAHEAAETVISSHWLARLVLTSFELGAESARKDTDL